MFSFYRSLAFLCTLGLNGHLCWSSQVGEGEGGFEARETSEWLACSMGKLFEGLCELSFFNVDLKALYTGGVGRAAGDSDSGLASIDSAAIWPSPGLWFSVATWPLVQIGILWPKIFYPRRKEEGVGAWKRRVKRGCVCVGVKICISIGETENQSGPMSATVPYLWLWYEEKPLGVTHHQLWCCFIIRSRMVRYAKCDWPK